MKVSERMMQIRARNAVDRVDIGYYLIQLEIEIVEALQVARQDGYKSGVDVGVDKGCDLGYDAGYKGGLRICNFQKTRGVK